MSRVVPPVMPLIAWKCEHCGTIKGSKEDHSPVCLPGVQPVQMVPASVARGLVEAMKDLYVIVDDAAKTTEPNWIEEMCGTNEEAVKRAGAALAAAEEALGK